MGTGLNADYSRRVVMRTAAMDWQPSPSPKVWRKRLDLVGPAEQGRVTSIVRYDADSAFPAHDHPGGEEILVLDGTFRDEHGSYPRGTYLLNPEGFRHAPFSTEGCVLFVKLRQYAGRERAHVAIDTGAAPWRPAAVPGSEYLSLYDDTRYPDAMYLVRLAAGTRGPAHDHPGGEEILVLDGMLEDEHGRYEAGDWVRDPDGSRHQPFSRQGCLLYVKRGHLG